MLNRILFVLATVSLSIAAHAAEGTSESNQSSFMDSVYLNYFGTFNGPGVNSLDNTNALNGDGLVNKSKTAYGHMNFDSEITAAYLVNKDVGIGPVIPFVFYPTQGYGAVLGDVGIKTFDKHFIQTQNFNAYANIIFQLPSSDASKNNGMDFAIKTTPNFRYNVPNSRLAFGAWTEAKAYLGVYNKVKSFKLYGAPYANYQLSPKISANLEFEMESSHFNNVATPLDFTMVKTDLQPGFVFVVTPTVIVNPYLQVFTSDKIAMDRTALGAVISASL